MPVATPSLHAVRAGYVVGVTNPKTIVFFAALLPQFVVQSSPVFPQLVALGAVFAVLALLMDGTVALVASRARDWFASSPRRMERVGGAGGPDDGRPRHRPAAHRPRRLTLAPGRTWVKTFAWATGITHVRRRGPVSHQAVKPPSTSRSVPVTNEAWSPRRNTTGSATSSTCASRAKGVCAANPALTSGGFRRVIAVRV